MKHARRMMALAFCALSLTMAAPTLDLPVKAAAGDQDVTDTLKGNKDIKYIAKKMDLFASVDLSGVKKTRKDNKLSEADKLDIVCASMENGGIDTKDLLDNKYARIKEKNIQANYKKLFGGSIKLDSIKSSSKSLKIQGDKVYHLAGDFGEGVPGYYLETITQKADGTYEMVLTNDFKDYSSKLTYFTEGATTVTMAKSGSKYIVTGYKFVPTGRTAMPTETLEKYASVLNGLKSGQGYALANIGGTTQSLFVTDYTYRYDDKTVAAIGAKVYTLDATGTVVQVGEVQSAGTAYPLAVNEGSRVLFYGTGHEVNKASLSTDGKSLDVVESAEEDFDTNGKATYYYNKDNVSDDSNLKRMFTEWLDEAKMLNFVRK